MLMQSKNASQTKVFEYKKDELILPHRTLKSSLENSKNQAVLELPSAMGAVSLPFFEDGGKR